MLELVLKQKTFFLTKCILYIQAITTQCRLTTLRTGMGGGTQSADMAICHPMFLEVGPRGWPGVARMKGGHLTMFAVPYPYNINKFHTHK